MPFIPCNTTINVLHGVLSFITNCTLKALSIISRFEITLSLRQSFPKNDIVHSLIDRNSRTISFKEEETDVGRQRKNQVTNKASILSIDKNKASELSTTELHLSKDLSTGVSRKLVSLHSVDRASSAVNNSLCIRISVLY